MAQFGDLEKKKLFVMKKILHVMLDDKFNDRAVVRFEEVSPGRSIYVAVHPDKSDYKYIKSDKVKPCTEREILSILSKEQIGAVIFHSLPFGRGNIVRSIPRQVKIAWIGWGYDYYPTLLRKAFPYPDGLLEPLTIKNFYSPPPRAQVALHAAKKIVKSITGLRGGWLTKKDYARIDFFIPVLKREWSLARELNPWFCADYIPWLYSRNEGIDVPPIHDDAEHILVGNSATLTNNHADAFNVIADTYRNGDFNRIVCPLSYGSKDLVSQICDLGSYYFGKRFYPLLEFMERSEYYILLQGCHTVFMNHIRQQAGGNLNWAFSSGARVVLNSKSVLAAEYKDRGLYFEFLGSHEYGHLSDSLKSHNMMAQKKRKKDTSDPEILRKFIDALD